MHARVVCGHMLPRQICKNGAICCVCVVWLDQILSQNNSKNCFIYIYNQGRMQDFPGGAPNYKILWILDNHAGKRISRAAKLRAVARGLGACPPPKKIF